MRARSIKPGLYKDEDLATLPMEARWLFPALWMLSDCLGRLEDRPKMIKAEAFPYDDNVGVAMVHRLLGLLHDAGFIRRYEVDGRGYIQVVNFEKHQNPHKNEKDRGSQIPDPPIVDVVPKITRAIPLITGALPSQDGTSRDDSGIMIHVSLNPPPQEIPKLDCHSEYPLTIAEIRKHDPAIDEMFVLRLVHTTVQHCMSHPKFPESELAKITDKVISQACAESFATGPPGHRAGLLLKRVPPIIVTWALEP